MDIFSDQSDASPPVTKVGAVILRLSANGAYEVLIAKPKPKNAGDHAPMGLVRGTRKYWAAASQSYVDADHDGKTLPHGTVMWEPVRVTLANEVAEEAGIPPAMLAQQRIHDLGVHPFASINPHKTPYSIHWFVVVLDGEAQQAQADIAARGGIADSLKTQWMNVANINAFTMIRNPDAERISPGYLPVIEAAIALVTRLGTN